MPTNAIIELEREEMNALGLVLSEWRAEHIGLNDFASVLALASALLAVDTGVMAALIDSVFLKFSIAEQECWGNDPEHEMREVVSRQRAKLDQVFAQFKEEGRTLFALEEDEL